MNEGVEEAEEGRMAAWGELNSEPNGHWHNAMVDHVQSRYVVVFLSEHEEDCIKEFCEFRDIVPPASSGHSHSQGIIGVVHRLASVAIVV